MSFLCFVVVKPDSYEVDLPAYTYANRKGVFACDDHLVVSNSSILESLHHLTAGRDDMNYALIDSPLEANLVDGYANVSAIFRKVWHSIVQHELFRLHDWVVKLDMDAVVSARRLRQLISSVPPESSASMSGVFIQNFPTYFKNPWPHLQGPLEVLSKRAVEVLVTGDDGCDQSQSSEDWWLHNCMVTLGIIQVNGTRLGGLDGPLWNLRWGRTMNLSDASTCGKLKYAAFHPFKNVSAYAECVDALEAYNYTQSQ